MIPRYNILSQQAVLEIHAATTHVLGEVGVKVHHAGVLERMAEAGGVVDRGSGVVRISEKLLMESLAKADKAYVLYGRDGSRTARMGYDDIVTLSSPGQYSWVDPVKKVRRTPTSQDTRQAISLGDALPHVDIVGGMTQPADVPTPIRDIWVTAELVKGTRKPTRCWIANGATARYILEIYVAAAGGSEKLRLQPQIEAFIEPISPLQMPATGMEILIEFTRLGLPICCGPMVQAGATGPVTLAGTLIQENAEVLAGVVIAQVLRPGTPVMYGGIPHIMDMRTMSISFGSPEQALMAAAMVQIAKSYGLPAYVNTGLTDSKLVDAQAGLEKGMTFLLGALAGGDLLAHLGIAGADQGASLPQLVVDNEMVSYVKRVVRGFDLDLAGLALEAIAEVGHGGNHLAHSLTLAQFRTEFWRSPLMNRQPWDAWIGDGGRSLSDQAADRAAEIMRTHHADPIDEALAGEIDGIVASARRHLL